jgi:deoxyribonuclease IV
VWLGAHIGIADGLPEAPGTGRRIGCEAIQIFSKSPKLWAGPPLAPDAAAGFRAAVRSEGLKATAIHHGYLVNLASPKKAMLARSRKTFIDEIQRAEMLGVDSLIFHPGAHLESGRDEGLRVLVESLNKTFAATAGGKVRILLENAAGQGTALGSTFVDLAEVLARLDDPARAGVTIDTCHLFASGVDFRTPELYGATMDRLDRELGVDQVRAFHLNDAKADLGSHLDRHENIGRGQIGLDGFRSLVNDPRWSNTPGFLETPLADDDYAAYAADLATLRGLLVLEEAAAKPPRRPAGARTGATPK